MIKLSIVFLCLIVMAKMDGVLVLTLQKSLYIPGGGYSVLNITNNLGSLSTNIVSGSIGFNIVRKNINSNIKFDLYKSKNDQYEQFYSCYLNNINQITSLYQQNQPCNINCTVTSMLSEGAISSYSESLLNQQIKAFNTSYIIDNSLFPCQNGTYYPEVELFENLLAYIQPNEIFFYVQKISFLAMIEVLIILITGNIMLYIKYKKQVKRLQKLKQQNKQKQLIESMEIKNKKRNASYGSSSIEIPKRSKFPSFVMLTESLNKIQ